MKYLQYINATSSIFQQDTSRHVVESKLGLASYPGLLKLGKEKAWYTLFAHVH